MHIVRFLFCIPTIYESDGQGMGRGLGGGCLLGGGGGYLLEGKRFIVSAWFCVVHIVLYYFC